MISACVISSSCCWTSGGKQVVSVTSLVRGLLLEPASPLLPGLFAKEILFFLLHKVEGVSIHMVLFILCVFGYICTLISCIYGFTCRAWDFWKSRNSFFSSSVYVPVALFTMLTW